MLAGESPFSSMSSRPARCRRADILCRSLSDFSASDYDSSEDEYRKARSRRQSTAAPPKSAGGKAAYKRFDDDGRHGSKGLLDPNDPFADEEETPIFEKPRMQCGSSVAFAD